MDQRLTVAASLAHGLSRMQADAAAARSPALALRAALRRNVVGVFGADSAADAALMRMLRFTPGEDGELPALDSRLARLLDDASLVAGLVAATRVPVGGPGSEGERLPMARRSLGRDLRALAATRRSAADDLLTTLLRASREQLPRRLRRTLTLMADDRVPLDVYALVADLGWWDADDRRVQKRWAFHFWSQSDATGTQDRDDDRQEEER